MESPSEWKAWMESSATPRSARPTFGCSEIKRAFLIGLNSDSIILTTGELTESRVGLVESRSQSHEAASSPRVTLHSEDDFSDEEEEKTNNNNNQLISTSPSNNNNNNNNNNRAELTRYGTLILGSLTGVILASCTKRALSSIIRITGSGLVVMQFMSTLGYAEIKWKQFMKDILSIGTRRPETCVFRVVFDVIASSLERKIAFVCGLVGGAFLC